MKIDGRCHCGFITFEAEADPDKTAICHCADCQSFSGSGNGAAAELRRCRRRDLPGRNSRDDGSNSVTGLVRLPSKTLRDRGHAGWLAQCQ